MEKEFTFFGELILGSSSFESTLDITYSVSGRYYPATRDQPEEGPEIEITAVLFNPFGSGTHQFEIMKWLTGGTPVAKMLYDDLMQACWDDYEDSKYDEDGDRTDDDD